MKLILANIIVGLCSKTITAQQHPAVDTALTGTWKGSSICQIKPSACNDEIAVYHISATTKTEIYHVIANKVINGKEEDMAVEDFEWDPKKILFIATTQNTKWK